MKGKTKEHLTAEPVAFHQHDAKLEVTEDDSRQSDKLLRIFATSSPIGIYIVQNQKIQFTNPQFQELSGYSGAELTGMNALDLVLPEDRDLIKKNVRETLSGEGCSPWEYRLVSKLGEIRWVVSTLSRIDYRRRHATLGYLVDMTQRKWLEQELQNSGEKFFKGFRSSPDAMAIGILEDGRYIEVNDSYTSIAGYSREELIGHTSVELGFWLNPDYRDEMVRTLREQGVVRNLEIRFRMKSGEMRWGLVSAELITIGGEQCLISVMRDITEQKRIEGELRDSEEFSSTLLRNSPNPIFVANPDSSIRYVNPALEQLTGFSSSKLTGKKAPYPWQREGTLHETVSGLQRAVCTEVGRTEQSFKMKNGKRVWVEVTSVPVRKEEELKYYLSSWTDITEQKQLREDMQFYIGEVIRAQEEERKRIARELHDETVQTLASLHINIHNVMLDNQLSTVTRRRLEQLEVDVNNALEEVRRFSHELRPGLLEKLGLIPSLRFLVDELESEKDLKCRIKLTGSERRLSSEAEVILFRIVQEALHNIKKHSEATKAVVHVEFTREIVKLTVIDNGVGFELPRVLGNLARSGRLGLIGMRERARLLNGSFTVDSKVGRGTSITLELPVVPSTMSNVPGET